MKVVFLGTAAFAVPALRAVAAVHDVLLVISQPDRPSGRHGERHPTPVKSAAIALGLPVSQPERVNAPESVALLNDQQADVLVVAAYGQLLKPAVFDSARQGAINIHASLLPTYRGAAPVNWAIIRGESVTGISTFYIDRGMDTGGILLRTPLRIAPNEDAAQLEARLAALGAKAILDTLAGVDGGALHPLAQPEQGISMAPRMTREDGRIEWTRPARDVHNLVRGTVPWPGAWTTLEKERIKVHVTRCTGVSVGSAPPGAITVPESNRLLVACADELIELVEVQREGRGRTPGTEFLHGLRSRGVFI